MLLREKAITFNPLLPLAAGGLCFVAFAMLDRFGSDYRAIDFFSGMFCGISVVMNIWGLWLFGRQRRGE